MVGWTLNYEMFFYFIVSVSLYISKKHYINITIIFLIIFFISGNLINQNNLILSYTSNSIILEFILGILAYYIYKKYINLNNNLNILITAILFNSLFFK